MPGLLYVVRLDKRRHQPLLVTELPQQLDRSPVVPDALREFSALAERHAYEIESLRLALAISLFREDLQRRPMFIEPFGHAPYVHKPVAQAVQAAAQHLPITAHAGEVERPPEELARAFVVLRRP